jgi:hypothetical protein
MINPRLAAFGSSQLAVLLMQSFATSVLARNNDARDD